MPEVPSTPLILASPQIHLPNAASLLTFEAEPQRVVLEADQPDAPATKFTAIGYRQTEMPAAKGGKANSNGFRFRHKAMRSIARTFRGTPFISGHNWSDIRARGGTNIDAWADPIAGAPPSDLGIYYKVELAAPWAIEALANGTLDRFSLGAQPNGEITCTVHGSPVWTECYCWPLLEVDGQLAEWEHDDAIGVELSGVNVPAVGGTSIVEIHASSGARPAPGLSAEVLAHLGRVCGRVIPKSATAVTVDLGVRPNGGLPRAPAPITMASDADPRGSTLMDLKLIAKMLGMPETATEEEIKAAVKAAGLASAELGTLRAEVDAQHVEDSLAELGTTHTVSEKSIATLRAKFAAGGRAAFDENLAVVAEAAPERAAAAPATPRHALALAPMTAASAPIAPGPRGRLQSDAPVVDPLAAAAEDLDGPDAYEQIKGNPHAPRFFRWAGLTAADVKKHGPRMIAVQPDLLKIIAQSA